MVLYNSGHRYFVAVAESNSIRKAADKLRIAQSAVSRQIHNLEAEMDCELFNRDARGVTLTAAGSTLLRFLRQNAELSEQLMRELDQLKGIQRGHVVVAVVEGFATNGLPEVLSRFSTLNPAVTLEILVQDSKPILKGIEDGRFDIGVIYNPHSPNLHIHASVKAPLCALMNPLHPLAHEPALSISDLLAYPMVVPARNGGSRELFDAARLLTKTQIHPVIETNSAHVAAAFLQATNGIGILSPRTAAPYLNQNLLVAIPMREANLNDGYLAVVTCVGRTASPASEILCSMLCQSIRSIWLLERDSHRV